MLNDFLRVFFCLDWLEMFQNKGSCCLWLSWTGHVETVITLWCSRNHRGWDGDGVKEVVLACFGPILGVAGLQSEDNWPCECCFVFCLATWCQSIIWQGMTEHSCTAPFHAAIYNVINFTVSLWAKYGLSNCQQGITPSGYTASTRHLLLLWCVMTLCHMAKGASDIKV